MRRNNTIPLESLSIDIGGLVQYDDDSGAPQAPPKQPSAAVALLKTMPALRSLRIGPAWRLVCDETVLSAIGDGLPDLRSVDLHAISDNFSQSVPCGGFSSWSKLSRLVSVKIDEGTITSEALDVIIALPCARELLLPRLGMDVQPEQVSKLFARPQGVVLSFTAPNYTDDDAPRRLREAMAAQRNNLSVLNIKETTSTAPWTAHQMRALLQKSKQVESFGHQYSPLESEVVLVISQASQLRHVALVGCDLQNSHVEVLLTSDSIESLNLSSNMQVSSQAFTSRAFVSNTVLSAIDVNVTSVDASGIKAIFAHSGMRTVRSPWSYPSHDLVQQLDAVSDSTVERLDLCGHQHAPAVPKSASIKRLFLNVEYAGHELDQLAKPEVQPELTHIVLPCPALDKLPSTTLLALERAGRRLTLPQTATPLSLFMLD